MWFSGLFLDNQVSKDYWFFLIIRWGKDAVAAAAAVARNIKKSARSIWQRNEDMKKCILDDPLYILNV